MNSSSDGANDDGVTSILRSIQKPLSTIGRIFSDQDTSQSQEASATSTPTPQQGTRLLSPAVFQPPTDGRVPSYDAQEAAARQASAEAAEARRIQRQEHRTIVETLCGMFPNLDKEVIDDVVRQKEGRVGLAVDACLALTAGS
jgi:hypothetical protein